MTTYRLNSRALNASVQVKRRNVVSPCRFVLSSSPGVSAIQLLYFFRRMDGLAPIRTEERWPQELNADGAAAFGVSLTALKEHAPGPLLLLALARFRADDGRGKGHRRWL